MSDSSKQRTLLDVLKVEFERLHARLDRTPMDVNDTADVANLKHRVSSLEIQTGHMQIALGEANGRLDRLEARLARIEQQHDAIKALSCE